MTQHDVTFPPHIWTVVCLCAQWCGTCRSFQEPFLALTQLMPDVSVVWLDLEDDAEIIGEIDVTNLPTLMIARDDTVLFAGTIRPQTVQVEALLRAGRDGGLNHPDARAPEEAASGFQALLEQLRARASGLNN